MQHKIKLPIDNIIPDIQTYLKNNSSLILQATPGAGKTTRVPPALLKVTDKNILVLEPRRLAARLSAHRVAQEMDEECGQTIGYQIRYEKKESQKTRIKFITEGLFLRLLISNPNLSDVGCVVLDEFHERHIHSDVALMFISLLQKTTRPDLKCVVMSATLETKSLSQYIPQAKVFICETPSFPVTTEYLSNEESKKSLDFKVYTTIEKILKNSSVEKGHILVFLPGRQEIHKCFQKCVEFEKLFNIKLYTLSADTSVEDQQKIFLSSLHQKIIFSTNVAETSLTIEGVTDVIDCGLAKISGFASWSGFSTLQLKPISQSACIQRAGRAGRTRAGHSYRLFSLFEFNCRQQFEVPEILRSDLTQILLELKTLQQEQNISSLPWFDAPPAMMVDSCAQLLVYLEAFDEKFNLTQTGKLMCDYAFHPRLSRILVEGKKRNLFAQALLVVCLLSEGSIFKRKTEAKEYTHSDISYECEVLKKFFIDKNLSSSLMLNLEKNQIKKIENLMLQLARQYKISFQDCFKSLSLQELSCLLLSAFPDRVCKIRQQEHFSKKNKLPEYNLCLGGGALLSASSSVVDEEYILALEAEENVSKIQSLSTQIEFCHGIDKSILLLKDKHFVSENKEVFWNSEKQAAVCVNRIYYGKLVLKEEQIHGQEILLESILVEELKKSWPLPFESEKALQYFNTKIHLAKMYGCPVDINPIIEEDLEMFFYTICESKKSFSQIGEKKLQDYIDEYVGFEKIQQLNAILPSHIVVGKGRKIEVHYEEDKPPYISSRLQDFFGTTSTPRILNGKLNLVVHLLAPNMQSVQVTTDLAGFWERGYHDVRKELSRRYPRHSWAEDPKNAEPPELFRKRIR